MPAIGAGEEACAVRERLTFQDAIIYGRRCLKNGRPFIKPNFAGGSCHRNAHSCQEAFVPTFFGITHINFTIDNSFWEQSICKKKYSFWKYQLNLLRRSPADILM
jgi:hypothetical protein